MKKITFPITEEQLKDLQAGDRVLASGYLYTARDAAHKRMYELLNEGKQLPIDVSGQTIYYVGAAPAKPGYAVGPCGPTSSYRMDKYTPDMLDLGLKGSSFDELRNVQSRGGVIETQGCKSRIQ